MNLHFGKYMYIVSILSYATSISVMLFNKHTTIFLFWHVAKVNSFLSKYGSISIIEWSNEISIS